MAIPSVKQFSQEPGGGIVAAMRGINSLTNEQMQALANGSAAEYAPYTNYANALSKLAYANYLPFQIQAQILSNPMIWMSLKDNPEAIKSMMSSFNNSVPNVNAIAGMIPQPKERQNPLSGLVNFLTGNQAPQNAPQNAMMAPANAENNGQNPFASNGGSRLAAGGMQGMINAMTKKFAEQPNTPGKVFVDSKGDVVSTPSNEVVTQTQTAIQAAKRVEPQIERLSDLMGDFLTIGGLGKLGVSQAINLLGGNTKTPSKYAAANAALKTAPESLVKAYGLKPTVEALNMMKAAIEPEWGESKINYQERLKETLEEIRKFQQENANQLAEGFTVKSNQLPKNPVANPVSNAKSTRVPTDDDINFTAQKYNMTPAQVKELLGIK